MKWEDSQGQPQTRRNVITTGLPSPRGNCNLGNEGALKPILGIGAVSIGGGDFHDASSCWNVIDAITDEWVAQRSIEFRDLQGVGSDRPVAVIGFCSFTCSC
jgi:hypothetical protein